MIARVHLAWVWARSVGIGRVWGVQQTWVDMFRVLPQGLSKFRWPRTQIGGKGKNDIMKSTEVIEVDLAARNCASII